MLGTDLAEPVSGTDVPRRHRDVTAGRQPAADDTPHVLNEAVWGIGLDPRNFQRKVTKTLGFVVPSGATTTRDCGRPAQLFRRGTGVRSTPLTR